MVNVIMSNSDFGAPMSVAELKSHLDQMAERGCSLKELDEAFKQWDEEWDTLFSKWRDALREQIRRHITELPLRQEKRLMRQKLEADLEADLRVHLIVLGRMRQKAEEHKSVDTDVARQWLDVVERLQSETESTLRALQRENPP